MTKEQLENIQAEAHAIGKTRMDPGADESGFFPCETVGCAMNDNGTCRFSAVYGCVPFMTEEDGCLCTASPDEDGQAETDTSSKTPMDPGADENGFFPCDTETCAFNNNGMCRFSAVYGCVPYMTEEDGCLCAAFPEEYLPF